MPVLRREVGEEAVAATVKMAVVAGQHCERHRCGS